MEIKKEPYVKITVEVLAYSSEEAREKVHRAVGMSNEMKGLVKDYNKMMGRKE